MAEVFANKIRTTVAATYVAASGTLEVASATGMPATGNFRVRLGNVAGSILRVTARAGTTLTVDVEQDDGNAAIGDTVRLVNTAAAMEALKADAIAGGGGSGMPWWPTLTPMDQSAWAWVNQGTATVTQSGDVVRLVVPASGAENFRVRTVAAPATPYTFTALVGMGPWYANIIVGLGLRESATEKICISGGDINASGFFAHTVRKMTSPTVFSGTQSIDTINSPPTYVFLRVAADGTNVSYSYSYDGQQFITRLTETKATFFTTEPDHICITGASFVTASAAVAFMSLDQT